MATPSLPSSPTLIPTPSQPTLTETTTSETPTSAPAETTSTTTTALPSSASSIPPSSTSSSSESTAPPTSSDTTSQSSVPPTSTSSDLSSTSSLPSTLSSQSPSAATPPPSSSQSFEVSPSTSVYKSTQSNGGIVYVTTVVRGTTTPTAGISSQSNDSSKGFFDNKGAVAGVFTVVGLVGLAILVAVLTNAVRRHRAKKFDRDVAEAAAEAAAAAHALPPDFGDDDDYGYQRSGYTDASHGTYAQQPMHVGESYNMSQLPPFDSYGQSSGAMAGIGGAAGNAGVGATGLNRSRSTTAPYNAFAGPQTQPPVPMPVPHDPFYDPQSMHDPYGPYAVAHNPQAGILEAAGLTGGAGVATGATLARGPSQHQSSLSRSKSSGGQTLGSGSDHQQQTYVAHYQPGFNAETHQPQPYPSYSRPVSMTDDPYAGYTSAPSPRSPSHSQPGMPRTNSPESVDEEPYSPFAHHEDESRMSLHDEEDYGYNNGRRVLKVANE